MERANSLILVLIISATSFAGTWLTSPGKGSHAGAVSFTPSSATWDGVNDRMTFSGSAVSMTEGATFSISFWVNSDNNAGGPCIIQGRNNAGGSQWRINIGSSNALTWVFQNSVPATIVQGTSDALITTGVWHHVVLSFDTSSSSLRHCYIDGTEASDTWATYTTGQNAALNRDSLFIGADDSFGSDFGGCLSELWVDDTYVDFSVSGNRDKFTSGGHPVNLGATGSTPTGSAPDLYMRFVSGSLGVNSGADGGTATITGDVANGDCGTP